MSNQRWKCVFLIASSIALGGCGFFPHSGPDYRDIKGEASDGVAPEAVGAPLSYALVDLTARVLSLIPDFGVESIYATFGRGSAPPPVIRIAQGDVIQVTVFESQSGGLFIPREASVRPGNFVTFPPQTVDRSGKIEIPYANKVEVLGRSVNEIQDTIRQRLAPLAIQPQIVVSVVDRATDVSVIGEVNLPNQYKINYKGDRILDIISRAGGIRFPGWDTYVSLQRNGRKATIFFNNLVNHPQENIFVRPGDIVYVYRQQRFYSVFGASGVQSRFDFDAERIYLADAVGRATGLQDAQANPGEVYVYRIEDREQVNAFGVTLSAFPPDQHAIPTIYHVNLRQSDGFFLAQRFPLRDRDIVYVSNADDVEVRKLLSLVGVNSNTTSAVATSIRLVQSIR
jgi:polysaccharide export outer membrane protein